MAAFLGVRNSFTATRAFATATAATSSSPSALPAAAATGSGAAGLQVLGATTSATSASVASVTSQSFWATCSALSAAALLAAPRLRGRRGGGAAKRVLRQHRCLATAATATATAAPALAKKLTEPSELLESVDVFIFDCDGVIWRGDSVIEGVAGTLEKLRAAGKRIFFVTNNSTKSRAGYQSKFTGMGIDVRPEEIFSSSFAAAAYFEQTKFAETGKKVYVIGERGLGEELDLVGVPWLGGEEDAGKVATIGPGGRVEIDKDVGAVVVGFDRHISYYKLQYAQLCLNSLPNCEFIATNLDRVTHLTDAQEWAGNATMVGAVKGCTGREPTLVGKPAPLMIDYIAEKYGIQDRSQICMVGDRLDTDISFGRNNGLRSCLTLTGVTTEPEVLREAPRKPGTEDVDPDYYVDSINDFFRA